MGWVSWPLYIFVFLASFSWRIPTCVHSTWLQNRNLYWIFLDEVGSDQSGGILSPFMGTACLDFFTQFMTNFNCIWFQGNFEFLLCDFLAATKQLYEWFSPSVCPSHLFDYVPIIVSSRNFQELLPMTEVMSMQKVKVIGQRSRSQRSWPNLAVSGL